MNEDNRTHLLNSLKQGIRADGRSPEEYRDVTIETDVVANAEGSARVRIGDTEVIAGVKMAIETPYPDTPDQGNFMVNVELLPMSNPEFESGPPSIDAIELARVTDRGIRESKAIDTKRLCIEEGKHAWGVIVDICPINAAGNLFDAASIAALAALKNTKLPETDKIDDRLIVNYKKKTDESLPLTKLPIAITINKIEGFLLVDPTSAEEKAVDTRLTVASMDNGELCALQKGGNGPFTVEEIEQMIDLGISTAAEIRKKL
ncbi:exosome complex protein Rrp42 [Candidatus Woesearchaeota archaeon]|nr:exosome complex protein Rrp42 [Candidatus Woesearchaeota archaeon]